MQLRKRSFTILLFLILSAITSMGAPATFAARVKHIRAGDPVRDKSFEKRLSVVKTYRTSQPETLQTLAHLLYGHQTWWPKIIKLNPKLNRYGLREALPVGTKIRYKAPRIGREYIVQKNDWLVRIALWKYGDTDAWNKLYENNLQKIAHPNLIHPGDRLSFDARGNIQKTEAAHPEITTAIVTVAPSPEPVPSADPVAAPVVVQDIVVEPVKAEPEKGPFEFPKTVVIVGAGILLLALLAFALWATWQRMRPMPSGQHKYELDRSLLYDVTDGAEIEQPPGYDTVKKFGWRKYLKFFSPAKPRNRKR